MTLEFDAPSKATKPTTLLRGVRPAEQLRLLRGQGRYLDDLEPAGTLHLAFVRSQHAHARIVGIDTSAAEAAPGVVRVLTSADLEASVRPCRAMLDPKAPVKYGPTDWYPLARRKVRYVGEAVAVVVADDRYRAEDAAALVDVEYELLTPLTNVEQALAADAPRVHEELPDNVLFHMQLPPPKDPGALEDPTLVRVKCRFHHPRVAGSPMENCGVLADYDAATEELTLRSSTQIPHLLRDALSECLSLPASNLRVIAPDVGGGFGTKMQLYPEETISVFLARELKRPVKWVQDRMENLLAATHARDIAVDAELLARPDGQLVGLRARAWCDAGAYNAFPLTSSMDVSSLFINLPSQYRLPALEYEGFAVATNKSSHGPYRGVGQPVGVLVIEGLMNLMASKLGMDPIELRRANMVTPDQFPFFNAAGVPYDSGDYPALLTLALDRADYAGWREEQKRARAAGRLLGIGIASYAEATSVNRMAFGMSGQLHNPGFDSAVIRVDRAGRIEVAVSTPSQGQTQATAFRRLAQGALGVSADSIHVSLGDTARTPYGTGTYASRSMVSGGGALLGAARKLKDKMARIAAAQWDIAPEQVEYRDGEVVRKDAPDQRLGFEELATLAHVPGSKLPEGMEPGLEASCFYDPPMPPFSPSVHLVLVEVDRETGRIRPLRYVVAEDCGPMVNPQAVEGQIRGGIAQGLGAAYLEDMIYDDGGQMLTASLMDYLLPGSCDVPPIEIVHMETPSPYTEGGLKGVGESGAIGAVAALSNAVIDAIGCRPQLVRMPLTPERVLKLLDESAS